MSTYHACAMPVDSDDAQPRAALPDSLGSITIYDEAHTPAVTRTEYRAIGRPRLLDIPEARVLADLISAWHDFDMAVTCLNRLIAVGEAEDAADGILEHAMWITAVVHGIDYLEKVFGELLSEHAGRLSTPAHSDRTAAAHILRLGVRMLAWPSHTSPDLHPCTRTTREVAMMATWPTRSIGA
jgi:hypothetical protein